MNRQQSIIELQPLTENPSIIGKRITVVSAESGKHHDLMIQPGTSAREILNQLGLDDNFILTTGRGQEPFAAQENVFESIPDGAKLYASTPVEVGSWLSFLKDSLGFEASTLSPIKYDKIINLSPNSKMVGIRSNLTSTIPSHKNHVGSCSSNPTIVHRDMESYWQQRKWRKKGDNFTGYFRTLFGSWEGRAEVSPSGRVDIYIHDPPEALANHPNWRCFFSRPGGWFLVHHHGAPDLSSAIMEIERILTQAYKQYGT